MLEKLEEFTLEAQRHWNSQINESKDGTAKEDMAEAILGILQKFLMHVVLGANLDDTKVQVLTKDGPNEPFRFKDMLLSEATEEIGG